jgi:aminopeptidase N
MLPTLVLAFLSGVAAPAPASPALRPLRYEIDLRIDYEEELLRGRVRLTFENASDAPVATVPLTLHRLMRFTSSRDADGRPLPLAQDVVAFEDVPTLQVNAASVTLPEPLAPGVRATIDLEWEGYLVPYTEVFGYVRERIDPAFTILRPDAMAYPQIQTPSFRSLRESALAAYDYVARITVPLASDSAGAERRVVNGGRLVETVDVPDGSRTWVYQNYVPAWRMDFAVGPYRTLERGGNHLYYFPEDSAGAARAFRALGEALDLLTGWFGPLRGERRFSVIEIPDGFGSQADVTSILQTAAALRDSTRLYEIYHEVSHLWNVDPTDDSPRWNEGLASFLQHRMTEDLEGRRVLDERLVATSERLRRQLVDGSDLATVPMIDYGRRQMTDASYRVGMLLFDALYRLVGRETFGRIVGGFYAEYVESGGSTEDFVRYAEETAPVDLGPFFEDWMYTTGWVGKVEAGLVGDALADAYR